jgi:diguanylate cyclase (GGDEF)-like protein
MRRFSTPLTAAFSLSFLGLVGVAAAIGAANDGHLAFAVLAWAVLAFVLAATLAEPARAAGPAAALAGALLYAAGVFLQMRADHATLSGSLAARQILVPAAALLIAPFLLRLVLDEVERAFRQIRYQATVIDDLTVRDTETGAFKPKYVESILAEEIDRARRYHRSLTLSIVAADDWATLLEDVGEVAARNVAQGIVEQLSRGTRTVDKIIQLGEGTFAIVLPETPLEGAEVLAARLQASASREAGILLRIGLADFPRDAVTGEALIAEAREALTFARIADLLVVDRTLLGQRA